MLKLVSFFIFLAALIWSWFLFHTPPKISLQTHAGIQSKFMQLIEDSVKRTRPDSSGFEIMNMYTQKVNDNQVSAHFSYKFTDKLEESETADQVMSGEAVLTRGLSEDPEKELWVVSSVKTGSTNIEFQQGLIINPEGPAEAVSADTAGTESTDEKQNH